MRKTESRGIVRAEENMKRIASDPLLTSKDIRNMNLKLKKVGR